MQPKLSIIMPVLNREETIEKAILSVLEQSYSSFELIILDGGSTDRTVDIIKRYADRLSYWHSAPDGSAAAATNIGIKRATGTLIGLLMADDWYEPEIFKAIANAYLKNPNADMFTCAGRIVTYDQNVKNYSAKEVYADSRRMLLNIYNVCFDITSAICCRFIKRALYEKIGVFIPFDLKGKQFLTNDKEFLLRAIMHNANDIFVNQLGHTYLAHAGSYSFSNSRKVAIKHCEEHMWIAENYLQKEHISFKNRFLLAYWYNDQSARLALYKLIERKWGEALKTVVAGWRRNLFFWPLSFAVTTCRIFIKRSRNYLRRI